VLAHDAESVLTHDAEGGLTHDAEGVLRHDGPSPRRRARGTFRVSGAAGCEPGSWAVRRRARFARTPPGPAPDHAPQII
jgi:hypothetical protein